MWLILAGVVVILGFVFGDSMDLVWLIAIIAFVGFCLEKHYDNKKEKIVEGNMLKQFMLKTSGKASAIRFSKEYWQLKNSDRYTDEEIISIMRTNQKQALSQQRITYVSKNYVIPEALEAALLWGIGGSKRLNLSTLCDIDLIANSGLLDYSEDTRNKIADLIDDELRKNGIPENLIG